MHFLVKKTARLIASRDLLPAGSLCVVAVSGGADSMALLHLLAEMAPFVGVSLLVAHVDHGLRPAEAGQEAKAVREAAARLDLPCEIGAVAVRSHARENGLSLEHAARELRYRFLRDCAARHGAGRIAVGHTADDQAEEVLLRMIRGSGRAGLSGMALFSEGQVIRPLLTTTRQEVLAYLASRGIAHCEDSSNQDRRFLRNRIRLDLLPMLAGRFNPAIGETLRETAAILAAEEELLAALAGQACEEVMAEDQEEGALLLDLVRLAAHPLALQRRVLEAACWRMGCRPSFRLIDQLLRLALAGPEGGSLHLAKGLRAMRQGERLCLSHPQGRRPARGNLFAVPSRADYRLVLPAPGVYAIAGLGQRLVVAEADIPAASTPADPHALCLDAEAVRFPLEVRPFRPGDRFRPLGVPGSKKVGDFFTDQKVPPAERGFLPVLADQQGIVAVLPLRPDQRAALTSRTRRVLTVRLEPVAQEDGPPQNGFTGEERHGN
ncbi:MAG: tRNA lysidine(34) synthetase TilS [Thermodesulfobacteriota bacterium]